MRVSIRFPTAPDLKQHACRELVLMACGSHAAVPRPGWWVLPEGAAGVALLSPWGEALHLAVAFVLLLLYVPTRQLVKHTVCHTQVSAHAACSVACTLTACPTACLLLVLHPGLLFCCYICMFALLVSLAGLWAAGASFSEE